VSIAEVLPSPGSRRTSPTGSGPCSRQRRPSWPRPCAATWSSSPPSSRLAAWTWPTRHCASWPVAGGGDRRGGRVRHHPTHVEDYKVWLAAQPGCTGPALAKNTQRQRLRMIRIFFERLIEWDWPEAHHRNPILHGTSTRPEPLPKFSLTRMQPNCWPQPRPTACPLSPGGRDAVPDRHAGNRALRAGGRRSLGARRSTGCASPSASCATTA